MSSPTTTSAPPKPVSGDPGGRLLVAPLLGASVVLGAAAAQLASGSLPFLSLLFPVLLVPVLLWRYPQLGLYLLFASAITIEQFAYQVGPRHGAATAVVPMFQRVLPGGANVAELLLLVTLVIVVMQVAQRQERLLHRSPVLFALAAWMAMVGTFLLLGLMRGGEVNRALWEVRPYLYLTIGFLLASHLFTNIRSVRPLLWILVLGSAAKAVYGLVIFSDVRFVEPRPEAILAHEESFFFGLYIFATAAMWLFGVRGKLRVIATLLLPVVLACDMVNSRRTAWLILLSGLGLLGLVALIRVRERRRVIGAMLAVAVVAGSVYLPVFWNKTGTLAQPARAVRSAIAPDDRDDASNMYREIETYNLQVYINLSRSMGTGYGQRIQYFGLVDLTENASMLAYVPHNGVLYTWLRTGILGVIVWSSFLAQAMISAVRLTQARRRDVAMMGAIVAAALMGYVAMGLVDMGFFWFRNGLAMGILLGAVDGLRRGYGIPGDEPADEEPQPTLAASGRGRPPLALEGGAR